MQFDITHAPIQALQPTQPIDDDLINDGSIFDFAPLPNGNAQIDDNAFIVYTKNARINNNSKLVQLLAELNTIEWDVVLFSETRACCGKRELDGGHMLYTCINDNLFAGVGILLHAKHVRKNNKCHMVSGRIMALDFVVNKIKIRAIAVYMPHCGYPDQDLENAHDQLRSTLAPAQTQQRRLIVGGDFNSQIGIGMRGDMLQQIQTGYNLKLTNNSDTPWENQWICCSALGTKRKIDFIFASNVFEIKKTVASADIDLNSDHRCVKSIMVVQKCTASKNQRSKSTKGWRPYVDTQNIPSHYQQVLDDKLNENNPQDLQAIERMLYESATTDGVYILYQDQEKPWQSDELKQLIQQRKTCGTKYERMQLSKLIQKKSRKALRKYHDDQTTIVLQEFAELGKIDALHHAPVTRSETTQQIDCDTFADTLQAIYESPSPSIPIDLSRIAEIPPFKMHEFQYALKFMRNRKGADKTNIVAEMIKHAGPRVHQVLLDMYNQILSSGCVPDNWHVTIFTMLPKNGDLSDASNWRPIAILPILYKLFAKLLHKRLKYILEREQSDEQFGFRPHRRIDDVFTILEDVIGKCNEWNLPLWMASLDLKKTFDRIEFGFLFEALRIQNVPEPYIQLLAVLYNNQTGSVNGSRYFNIRRGVKQGDIISPMLFNAGLEIAFRSWKTKLSNHGILLGDDMPRFTNTRYADDIMTFAKSDTELAFMIEALVDELAKTGLHLNGKKTKIMTNENVQFQYLEVAGEMVAIIPNLDSHRYLGRSMAGNLFNRTAVKIKHRLQAGWYKFSRHSKTLTNRNISIKLRLKLFDSVVTPTILFGLTALPLHQSHLDKINVTQRKMLRKIAGWVRLPNEPWETTMKRMTDRVTNALQQWPIKKWGARIHEARWKHVSRLKTMSPTSLQMLSSKWTPPENIDRTIQCRPYRNVGRPNLRWDDQINNFCRSNCDCTWQDMTVDQASNLINDYVEFCDTS